MSKKLKYGVVRNAEALGQPILCEFDASQKLPKKSGRFVIYGASSTDWRAVASDEDAIGGYVEDILDGTNSADDKYPVFMDLDKAVFELPYATSGAAATLTDTVGKTLIGKTVDVYVDGDGIQYANCSSATDDLFIIVDYDVDENTVHVKVNPSKIGQAS